MTREEKIKKLNSLKLIVTNLTATYDMGLEFTILTGEGGDVNFGNIGNWPVARYRVTPALRSLHAKIKSGEQLQLKDLNRLAAFRGLFTYYPSPWSPAQKLDEDTTKEYIAMIHKEMSEMNLDGKFLYVFSSVEDWNRQLALFDDYSKLEDFIISEWGESVQSYESMDDDQLDYYFDCAEEEGWSNTMPI